MVYRWMTLWLPAAAIMAEEGPRFMPDGSGATAHPIVTAIKLIGMAATAVFVVVMVIRSIRVVKHDENDKVDLPD